MLLFIIAMLSLSFIPYRSYEDENYLRSRTFKPNNNRRRQNTFSTLERNKITGTVMDKD